MTFEEYLTVARLVGEENPEWRRGQTFFNVLYSTRPALANEVRGVWDIDPFFQDRAVRSFLNYVQSRWDEPE